MMKIHDFDKTEKHLQNLKSACQNVPFHPNTSMVPFKVRKNMKNTPQKTISERLCRQNRKTETQKHEKTPKSDKNTKKHEISCFRHGPDDRIHRVFMKWSLRGLHRLKQASKMHPSSISFLWKKTKMCQISSIFTKNVWQIFTQKSHTGILSEKSVKKCPITSPMGKWPSDKMVLFRSFWDLKQHGGLQVCFLTNPVKSLCNLGQISKNTCFRQNLRSNSHTIHHVTKKHRFGPSRPQFRVFDPFLGHVEQGGR